MVRIGSFQQEAHPTEGTLPGQIPARVGFDQISIIIPGAHGSGRAGDDESTIQGRPDAERLFIAETAIRMLPGLVAGGVRLHQVNVKTACAEGLRVSHDDVPAIRRLPYAPAEFGIAAHWRYKERGPKDDEYEQRINWLRRLMEWRQEVQAGQNQGQIGAETQPAEVRQQVQRGR